MPDNTTAAPAAPATQTVQPVGIVVNGQKLAFIPGINVRGKGAEKNAPLLTPHWSGETVGMAEVLRHLTALGEQSSAKAIIHDIVRPLYLEASKQSRVVNSETGAQQIDPGKFAAIATELLRNFTESQSEKSRLEGELQAIEAQVADVAAQVIAIAATGKLQPNDPVLLKSQQLLVKRTDIATALKNLADKKKKVATPSTPVAAPAPAPAA